MTALSNPNVKLLAPPVGAVAIGIPSEGHMEVLRSLLGRDLECDVHDGVERCGWEEGWVGFSARLHVRCCVKGQPAAAAVAAAA